MPGTAAKKYTLKDYQILAAMGCYERALSEIRKAPGEYKTAAQIARGWWCPEGVRPLQRQQIAEAFRLLIEDGLAVANPEQTAIRVSTDADYRGS